MAPKADNILSDMVLKQIDRVLQRGSRGQKFDQLRMRHFWSSYLFIADTTTNIIPAGAYDIFKVIPSQTGQGYPANCALTPRETNWLNGGRVPDNQNFVIMEIGATIKRPPSVDSAGDMGIPSFAPSNGIWGQLTAAQQTYINGGAQNREINAYDFHQIASGIVLEMSFLTNNVPLGLLSDFSQSAGSVSLNQNSATGTVGGDLTNGVPAASFRRKLEVPIMLQHGENMGMRLNMPRPIELMAPSGTGTGWVEVRVDWWAAESFTEKS